MKSVSALRAAATLYSGLGILLALANVAALFENRTYTAFATVFSIALCISCGLMGIWSFHILRRRIGPPVTFGVLAAVIPVAFSWGGLLLVIVLSLPAICA